MKRRFNTILLLIFAFAGVTDAQSNKIEDIVLKKVTALPEIRSFMETAKASKPLVMIASGPDKDFKYYWVKAGISDFDIFRASYNFYVDPKTCEIFYVDFFTIKGNEGILTLKQWRHLRTVAGWDKPHYYIKTRKSLALVNK